MFGINYFPEITGIGLYTAQMCEWLINRGHQVSVVTAFPYHPEWRIHREYRKKWFQTESIKGVNVYRSYLYVPKKITSISRVIHDLSFSLSSAINLLRQIVKKPDVIVSISPPFHLGINAWVLSRILRIPFVYHVQDLQIDAAQELNMINNRVMLNIMRKFEKFILNRASVVSTISEGMRARIINKGIDPKKVLLFPNWADLQNVCPGDKHNEFRRMYKLDKDDFIVLYAGNLGEKQGLETVIYAADKLRGDSNIKFLFVGEGAKKKSLMHLAQSLKWPNVEFLPLQPQAMLCTMLNAADICLISQQRNATNVFMPSKLTNILASGRPVIVMAESTCAVAEVVKNIKCGEVIEPENLADLAAIILNMAKDRNQLEQMGEKGRKYAEECLGYDDILRKYEQCLLGL